MPCKCKQIRYKCIYLQLAFVILFKPQIHIKKLFWSLDRQPKYVFAVWQFTPHSQKATCSASTARINRMSQTTSVQVCVTEEVSVIDSDSFISSPKDVFTQLVYCRLVFFLNVFQICFPNTLLVILQ